MFTTLSLEFLLKAFSIRVERFAFSLLTSLICTVCRAYGSGKEDSPLCDVPGFENTRMKLLRHVSFVDCPV